MNISCVILEDSTEDNSSELNNAVLYDELSNELFKLKEVFIYLKKRYIDS